MRDLLSVDSSDYLLANWRPLDHLIILELLFDQAPRLRSFSAALVEQIDGWMERYPEKTPLLYRKWIVGQPCSSRAIEVLGSLGLTAEHKGANSEEWARKAAYLAVFRSIILDERGNGTPIEELERRWGLRGLEGIEERWRDDRLWLLSGLAKILDLRCFYFHLREECAAESDRIERVKKLLRTMRAQIFDLQDHLNTARLSGPFFAAFEGHLSLPLALGSGSSRSGDWKAQAFKV